MAFINIEHNTHPTELFGLDGYFYNVKKVPSLKRRHYKTIPAKPLILIFNYQNSTALHIFPVPIQVVRFLVKSFPYF